MNDHRAWQKETALRHRKRIAQEADDSGLPVNEHALDERAAKYVGVTSADVEGWRKGRL